MELPTCPQDAWDRTDPRSLINMVTPAFQAAMIEAQKASPDLFGLDEKALFKVLRGREEMPSPTDNRLRMAFWLEYDRAQHNLCKMEAERVFAGVCTRGYFYGTYLKSAGRVAWLLTPVVEYEVKMREMLDFGMDRMRAILEIDPHPPGSKYPNVKLMELQAKLVAMTDLRLKGGHTQRTEQKSLHVHMGQKEAQKAIHDMSMEDVQRRIKELDRRAGLVGVQGPMAAESPKPPMKDVENE